jgi:hypothetical protein
MHVFDLQIKSQTIRISTLPLSVRKSQNYTPSLASPLNTVTMISAEASTAQKEQVLHNITWEVTFQMLLEFQERNNHVKFTQENVTQLIYSWVRNERQLYKRDPQSYDPLYYKRLTELGFQYSLNMKHTIFSEALVFITEFLKQHGQCVVPTHYPQNQQLDHWAK